MAYRQYFPAISAAEGGRPYSTAVFATDSREAGLGVVERSGYEIRPDLEMGGTRQRNEYADPDLGTIGVQKLGDDDGRGPVVTAFEEQST